MNFGARLKQLRIEECWSIRQFALATGLGMATIVDYEAGRRSPSFENVLTMCRVHHVSCEAFKDCEFTHEGMRHLKGKPATPRRSDRAK